jgi:hypothetical protein
MSTFNNRSTEALNIHKRFSTLELTSKDDCLSSVWNRSVGAKIKGGVLVQGTVVANCLTNEGNLTINGNLNVGGTIDGNLVGDFVTDTFSFMGTYTGNVKGCFSPRANVTVVQTLDVPNRDSLLTGYLGNCITNFDTSSLVCTDDSTDSLIFVTNGVETARMENNIAWQTNQGVAMSEFSLAQNSGSAIGRLAHAQGEATIANENCHVQGGNTTTELHGPMYIEGLSNKSTTGPSAITSGPYINVDSAHIQGIGNKLIHDTTFNHLSGESSNVAVSTAVCTYGFGHVASMCTEVHFEGHTNSGFKLSHCHIEGKDHVIGDLTLATSEALHIEGDSIRVEQGIIGHFEGAFHTTNYPEQAVYESIWAGGKEARVNQNYEWIRSSGKINTTGDAQTGIYTLHRTQFDTTPRALGLHATTPTGIPDGLKVLDDHVHMYEFNVVGRTNTSHDDYYSCNLLVVAKRVAGVYTIDTHKLNENENGHFIGKPNLISVGTTSVTLGTFSLLMDAIPSVGQEIYWAASAISTQVH